MAAILLALIGLPVGLVLDALIVRLGVHTDDDDGSEEEAPSPTPAALLSAERGAVVVDDSPRQALLRRGAVVAATSGLFALAALRYDAAGHIAIIAAYIAVLIVCAGTDLRAYRVPNVITYPAILFALAVGATVDGAGIGAVLAGGALGAGVLLVPSLLSGGAGMGMGDVKLLAFAGFALGFVNLVPAMLFMAIGGGGIALLLLVTGLRKRGEPIPYAPFISIGAIVALLWRGSAFIDLA
jgi:prepilin signal peptidase PulO-like enzyme (type II secretory pathway)